MDDDIKQRAQAALTKWTPAAEGAAEAQLSVPIHVLLGEAIDVAQLLEHHWQSSATRGKALPGFAGVAQAAQLTDKTAEEIRELQLAVTEAHSEYLVLVEAPDGAPMDRAEFVLSELRTTLEFAFDDGVHDDADEQLLRLQQEFASATSQDAIALALDAYAELADRYRDRLGKIEGFELNLIAEARGLGAQVRQRSASALTRNPAEQRQILSLRNRLITLLQDRVRLVRRAAQYVFRNFPDISRRFTSAFERRQRAARRRAQRAPDGLNPPKAAGATASAGAAAAGAGAATKA